MTVYVEYVLIDNFIIDYTLLFSVVKIMKTPVKKWRVVVSAMLGAVISLVFPLLLKVPILSIAVRFATGFLLTLIAHVGNLKSYIRFTSVFFAFTFISGGVITAVFSFFGLTNSSEVLSALVFIPVYLTVRFCVYILKCFLKKKAFNDSIIKSQIFCKNKVCTCLSLIDTGNGVYYKDLPVIIVSKRIAKKLISIESSKNIFSVQVNTVLGTSSLMGFFVDKIKVYSGDKVNIFNNVPMAISGESLGGEYEVILHPAMQGESNAKKDSIKTKKIS